MTTNTFDARWADNTLGFKKLHDALLAVGLQQTTDTGQTDPATITTYVATANYVYGYTIYKWTDAYQSTYPIYMRITWQNTPVGTAAYGCAYPQITVGTATDGAGTITGTNMSNAVPSYNTSSAADTVERPNYICYHDGSLAIALTPTSTNSAGRRSRLFYFIDRFRDLSGQKKGGIIFSHCNGFSSLGGHIIETKMMSPNRVAVRTYAHMGNQNVQYMSEFFVPYPWVSVEQASMSINGDIPFFPPYHLDPSAFTWNADVAVSTADTPYNTDFTVTRFGQNYTYKSLAGNFATPNSFLYAGSYNTLGWAMIWQ